MLYTTRQISASREKQKTPIYVNGRVHTSDKLAKLICILNTSSSYQLIPCQIVGWYVDIVKFCEQFNLECDYLQKLVFVVGRFMLYTAEWAAMVRDAVLAPRANGPFESFQVTWNHFISFLIDRDTPSLWGRSTKASQGWIMPMPAAAPKYSMCTSSIKQKCEK